MSSSGPMWDDEIIIGTLINIKVEKYRFINTVLYRYFFLYTINVSSCLDLFRFSFAQNGDTHVYLTQCASFSWLTMT